MSNYSQITFFAPKDTLPATDPNKTIFGAAYDVEFGNVATAIASKPDNLTVASFLSVTVTGNGPPANGIYLPSANALGFTSNSVLRATLASNGGLFMAGATGGSQGAGTINATGLFINGVAVGGVTQTSSFFTITYTGFTAANTGTAFYTLTGNVVTLILPAGVSASNAVTFTATGLPASIQPGNGFFCAMPAFCCSDNSAVMINSNSNGLTAEFTGGSGVIKFWQRAADGNGWTNSGNKGFSHPVMLTYQLN